MRPTPPQPQLRPGRSTSATAALPAGKRMPRQQEGGGPQSQAGSPMAIRALGATASKLWASYSHCA